MQAINGINWTSMIFQFLGFILSSIGMTGIFKKCKVPSWHAFVPFYRIIQLSKCADREEDGRAAVVCDIFSTVISTVSFAIYNINKDANWWIFCGIMIGFVIMFATYIYSIRVFLGLCESFSMKKKWAVVWTFFSWIPLMMLGFSKKYESSIVVRSSKTGSSGITSKETQEGLSIDIESRTTGHFVHKHTLLRDIHLTIEPGNMVLLLGGSGAGKTTFVNAVTGYEKAKAKITLKGKNVYKQYDQVKYEIGLAPQQELIRYKDTVYHTVADAAKLRTPVEYSRKEREERIDKALATLGLTSIKNRMVATQSGGQKKRISIAEEYIADPFLFVLDEPDSGLDGILARDLMQRLHDISREGKIVIVITHTPDRVVDLFDKIIVLAKDENRTGRLAFYGSIDEAKTFFGKDTMEGIVSTINLEEEGGEGRADELIEKYNREARHEGE